MRRAIAIATTLGTLALAAPASADYWQYQHQAERLVAGKTGERTTCRPQYRRAARPGVLYHRWVCGSWLVVGRTNAPATVTHIRWRVTEPCPYRRAR